MQIGVINSGALAATLSAGAITSLAVVELLPYTNEVVRLRVSGATLKAALENSLWGLRLTDAATNPDGRLLQLSSGLELRWHFKGAVPAVSTVLLNGEPLDAGATYTVATNDFVAHGGDGFSMFGVDGAARACRLDGSLVGRGVFTGVPRLVWQVCRRRGSWLST